MTLRLFFLVQLSSISSLKLLEMTYPTTPYKAAGDNDNLHCAKIETYTAKIASHKCGGASSGNVVSVLGMSNDSPCQKATDATLKSLKDAHTAADLAKAEQVFDRCCMQVGATAGSTEWADATDALGKGRLSGVAGDACGGWALMMDPDEDGAVDDPDDMTIKFYPTVTDNANIGSGGCKGIDSTGASAALNIIKIKVTMTVPGAIAPKDTDAAGGPAEMLATAATACDPNSGDTCTTNSLIEFGRTQCSKTGDGWWNADYTSKSLITIPKEEIVCGGFCTDTAAAPALTFYPAYQCLLTDGQTPGTSVCYSSLGLAPASADMPKAFNDPKVVNLAGEAFEILETGTFSMLRVVADSQDLLHVDATIDRAGSVCGATYIQNVSLSGMWVSDIGFQQVEVRANAAVPKKTALQISTDNSGNWLSPSELKLKNSSMPKPGQVVLQLNSVAMEFEVDSHRIVEGAKKTRRFANFLNMNVKGVRGLSASASLQIGGLLSTDSHAEASQLPADCEKADMKFISRAAHEQRRPCLLEKCGKQVPTQKR